MPWECSPVEGDLLGLDLAVLHIHLVPAQDNGDAFAHSAAQGQHNCGMSTGHSMRELAIHNSNEGNP